MFHVSCFCSYCNKTLHLVEKRAWLPLTDLEFEHLRKWIYNFFWINSCICQNTAVTFVRSSWTVWWGLVLHGLMHSELDLEMDAFVQPGSCGGPDKRLQRPLNRGASMTSSTDLLFPTLHWKRPLPFLFLTNQSVHSQFTGISLSMYVWCSAFTLWSDVTGFCILTCCCTLPLPVHLHGNPLAGQLLLPFSFFMLNSNHYFQRKGSPKLLY